MVVTYQTSALWVVMVDVLMVIGTKLASPIGVDAALLQEVWVEILV
jgi:hypothetical protein